jgi:trans-2,3-dihydro-3-hydroxyanthranilic acid synthase
MAGIPPLVSYPLPTRHDLPGNSAPWRLRAERAVLLIHDMQRYFIKPFQDPLRAGLLQNAASLRKRCADAGIPVAYTMQPGRMTEEQRGLLVDFWGPGMRTDPAEQKVVAELEPGDGDWQFTKWRYSAFFRSDLLDKLHAAGRDQLVLCGVYAHVGILATAVDAFTNDIQPFVAADALGDFSAASHRQTLAYLARCCAAVLSTEDILP